MCILLEQVSNVYFVSVFIRVSGICSTWRRHNNYRATLCIRGTSHGPVCLFVCLCLSQVGVLLKQLNTRSHKQHHTIAQGHYFSDAKDLREIRPGSPPTRAPSAGGVGQNRRISTNNRLYLENCT